DAGETARNVGTGRDRAVTGPALEIRTRPDVPPDARQGVVVTTGAADLVLATTCLRDARLQLRRRFRDAHRRLRVRVTITRGQLALDDPFLAFRERLCLRLYERSAGFDDARFALGGVGVRDRRVRTKPGRGHDRCERSASGGTVHAILLDPTASGASV